MILNPQRKSFAAVLLLVGVIALPVFTGFAGAAVGVRANAGASQIASQGDVVTFDGSRSYTLSGNNLTYVWDFNQSDGIQEDATGVIASHQYNETGIFTVTLTASDGAQSDTDETTVSITETNGTVPGVPNLPPVAIPPLTQLGFQNESMVFDGTRSFDPNLDNLSYEWDFNDLDGLTPNGDKQGSVVNWTYTQGGVYNITLLVSDGNLSDAARTSAVVLADNGTIIPGVNLPPVAVAEGDQVGRVGQTFNFSANRSFDLDGDEIQFTWDFNSDDGLQVDARGETVTKIYTVSKIYNVTLTASDGKAESTDILKVAVFPQQGGLPIPGVESVPPIAIIRSPLPGQRYDINESIHFYACNSTDPDGNSSNISYSWTFEQGIFSNECDTYYHYETGGLKPVVLQIYDENNTMGANTVTIFINGSGGPINRQPSGDIEAPNSTRVGTPTEFFANFTDPDGDNLTFEWDFDLSNGLQINNTTTGQYITHTFDSPCSCTVTVVVSDGEHRNRPVLAFHNIQVDPKETNAPTAHAGNDTTAEAGQGIVFDGSGNDSDGVIRLYEWDFNGDGVFDYANADSGWTIYTYPAEGNYSAVLRVTDDDNLTATDSRRVIVSPRPNNLPVADAGPDKPNETQGIQTFFHGTGFDSDGFVTLYEWDFEGDGNFEWSNSTSGDAFHTYANPGTYAAALRVTDDRGARATDVAAATVKRNQPPTADAGPDQNAQAGSQVAFSGTGSRDPEAPVAKYSWDFDSSDGIQEDYTGPTAAHTYTRGGTYLVTLTVWDALGQTDTDTAFVEVSQKGGVSLTVSDGGNKELAPEQSSSYLLNITNTGDGTDSFTLALSTDNQEVLSWYSLETRTVANLEAGGVRIVRLSVSIPKGALVDQETAITVSAASQFDTSKRAEVPVNTAVKALPKLQLVFVSFPTEAQAGSSIEVTVRVQNVGNADARIQFNPGSGDSGWLTIKTVLPQTVKPLKSLDLEFTLSIPAGTTAGSHTVSVKVTDLKGNLTETKSIQLNVKSAGGFIPALTTPALMLGLVAVAALLLHGAGPRRRP